MNVAKLAGCGLLGPWYLAGPWETWVGGEVPFLYHKRSSLRCPSPAPATVCSYSSMCCLPLASHVGMALPGFRVVRAYRYCAPIRVR